MLKDEERTLIAAGVDGPLTGTVATQFRDLIANNPEANRFYRSLLSDRDRLAALPKWPAPYSIAQTINQRIYPQIVPSTVRSTAVHRSAAWLPYAFAASVFVAVSAGSFLVFHKDAVRRDVADRTGQLPNPGIQNQLPDSTSAVASAIRREELPGPNAEQLPLPSGTIAKNENDSPRKNETLPNTNANDWLTARIAGAIPNLESVSARLPLLFTVADAPQAETKKRLVEEYFATTSVRLDLFVRDMPKALDVMQAAAKSSGVGTVVVPLTNEQLKRKLPISLAVYTDSLTANEHVNFLVKLADADKKSQAFSMGHLVSSNSTDLKEIKSLFGVDLAAVKRSNPSDANEPSVSSSTLDQVKQSINKDIPKAAFVTTFGPGGARVSASHLPELKAFFEKRGERPVSAIPALIVIRHVSEK